METEDVTTDTSEVEAISCYLEEWTRKSRQVSYLDAVLRDARAAFNASTVWLGAAGYLIAVEQVGHTVARPETRAVSRTGSRSAFKAAIADFASPAISEVDADALYSARCALAHRYGLANHKPDGTPVNVFSFKKSGPLIVQPEAPWDGAIDGARSGSMTTVVNLVAVQEAVERLVATLRSAHRSGDVVLVDGVSPVEVVALLRFTH